MLKTMTLFLPPKAQAEFGQPSFKIDVDDPKDLTTYLGAISEHNYFLGKSSLGPWTKEAMELLNSLQKKIVMYPDEYLMVDKLRKELLEMKVE